jgi:membrane protein
MATTGGVKEELNQHEKNIWELVALSPSKNLWNLRQVPIREIAKRTVKATLNDRLPSIAAELGFWFAFAMFPALLCATTILGLAARSAAQLYDHLLAYLALVVPGSALSMVLQIFHQTTANATPGKVTFGLVAAIWSASVGISAVQEATNAVYKLVERRSYFKARFQAILLTLLVLSTLTLCLACMFAGDVVAAWVHHHTHQRLVSETIVTVTRFCGWALAAGFLGLSFSAVYYWAPDLRRRQWHWISPGATLGVAGWLLASIGFRIDLHYFDSYSVTYGSLGAVIILLMWLYISGLMLLLGAEFNSELEAAAMEVQLQREKGESQQSPNDRRPFPSAA